MAAPPLSIEVIYALPERAWSLRLRLAAGATVADALAQARPRLLEEIPELEISEQRLAIFGRAVRPESPLHDGDRLELLRPLVADPKQARRQRAGRRP